MVDMMNNTEYLPSTVNKGVKTLISVTQNEHFDVEIWQSWKEASGTTLTEKVVVAQTELDAFIEMLDRYRSI